MPNHCRIANCREVATHVLLAHTRDWSREAVPADQAPDIVTNNIIEIRTPGLVEHGKPTPYYCQSHAEEKASHGK